LSILTVFNLFSVQFATAQDFEATLRFADYQYNAGNYNEASKSYRRALFFSEGKQNLHIIRSIAEISYHEKDYETAQRYYGLAYNIADNDSLKTGLLFNKASCRILQGNYQMALIDLFSVADTGKTVQRRLYFYLGTCYYGLQDFEKALVFFSSCVREADKQTLSDLFKSRKLNSPSPKKARILSMILPGMGQVYSGDIKSGFNSILLTSGLVVLGIRISAIYSPMDAVIAVLPWYQRYYTGGYGKAESIAEKRLAKHRNNIYRDILGLIKDSNEI